MNDIQPPAITTEPPTMKVHALVADFSSQAKLGSKQLITHIFELLKSVSIANEQKHEHLGALIVLGEFAQHDYQVPGIRLIHTNPLAGELIYVTDEMIEEKLVELFKLDGAMVIDQTGQILGARTFLLPEQADIMLEDEVNTRHIAAASASTRDDIIAGFTVSEETGKVRLYVRGKQEEVFDPREVVEKKSRKRKKDSEEE